MSQKRHGMRPAHIHFLISAPGYRELVTALYLAGDEHLDDDVVFGASGEVERRHQLAVAGRRHQEVDVGGFPCRFWASTIAPTGPSSGMK